MGDINLVRPDGKVVTVTEEQAEALRPLGYREETFGESRMLAEETAERNYYSTTEQQVLAGVEGAVSGVTLGLADLVMDDEATDKRAQYNPGARIAGELVGGVAPALLSGGAASARSAGTLARLSRLTPTGQLAHRAAQVQEAVGGVRGALAGGAIEGAVAGAGAEITRSRLANDDLTIEGVIASASLGGALGAGAGLLSEGLSAAGQRSQNLIDEADRLAAELAEKAKLTPAAARDRVRKAFVADEDFGALRGAISDYERMADDIARAAEEALERGPVDDAVKTAAGKKAGAAAGSGSGTVAGKKSAGATPVVDDATEPFEPSGRMGYPRAKMEMYDLGPGTTPGIGGPTRRPGASVDTFAEPGTVPGVGGPQRRPDLSIPDTAANRADTLVGGADTLTGAPRRAPVPEDPGSPFMEIGTQRIGGDDLPVELDPMFEQRVGGQRVGEARIGAPGAGADEFTMVPAHPGASSKFLWKNLKAAGDLVYANPEAWSKNLAGIRSSVQKAFRQVEDAIRAGDDAAARAAMDEYRDAVLRLQGKVGGNVELPEVFTRQRVSDADTFVDMKPARREAMRPRVGGDDTLIPEGDTMSGLETRPMGDKAHTRVDETAVDSMDTAMGVQRAADDTMSDSVMDAKMAGVRETYEEAKRSADAHAMWARQAQADARKAEEKAARLAEQAKKAAEREAKAASKEAKREAERAKRAAEREAEQARKQAEKAQRQAQHAADKAKKEADRAAKLEERAAKQQAKEALNTPDTQVTPGDVERAKKAAEAARLVAEVKVIRDAMAKFPKSADEFLRMTPGKAEQMFAALEKAFLVGGLDMTFARRALADQIENLVKKTGIQPTSSHPVARLRAVYGAWRSDAVQAQIQALVADAREAKRMLRSGEAPRGRGNLGFLGRTLRQAASRGASSFMRQRGFGAFISSAAYQGAGFVVGSAVTGDTEGGLLGMFAMGARARIRAQVHETVAKWAPRAARAVRKVGPRVEPLAYGATGIKDDPAEDRRKLFKKRSEELAELGVVGRDRAFAVAQMFDEEGHPEFAQALAQKMGVALDVALKNVPRDPGKTPWGFGSTWEPTPVQVEMYSRVHRAVFTPLDSFAAFAEGDVHPLEVEAVSTAYPGLYAEWKAGMLERLSEPGAMDKLSRQDLSELSVALQMELTPTQRPEFIAATQQMYAARAPQQNPNPSGPIGRPSGSSPEQATQAQMATNR